MAIVCASADDVVKELKRYDPLSSLEPFVKSVPAWAMHDNHAGPKEIERHSRKMEEVRRRFDTVVTDLLEQLPEFAEQID
jgi:hypothetical protein